MKLHILEILYTCKLYSDLPEKCRELLENINSSQIRQLEALSDDWDKESLRVAKKFLDYIDKYVFVNDIDYITTLTEIIEAKLQSYKK